MARYLHGSDIIPPEEVAAGSVTNEMAQRWMQLQQLQVWAFQPRSNPTPHLPAAHDDFSCVIPASSATYCSQHDATVGLRTPAGLSLPQGSIVLAAALAAAEHMQYRHALSSLWQTSQATHRRGWPVHLSYCMCENQSMLGSMPE